MSAPHITRIVKTVEYAYPTSPNATRFGFGRKGCYVVERHAWPVEPVPFTPIAAYEKREQAVEHARRIALEWSPMHLRYHPEDALNPAP